MNARTSGLRPAGSPPSRVRIIGGAWRGRSLRVLARPGLRPTPDRVRETLFNWLGQRLDGLRCLDLFAGSGVLGLEAASRGAARVNLVEHDRGACAALEEAAQRLAASGVQVTHADALQFLRRCGECYDVVFVDPPYGEGWIERIAAPLARVLSPAARIYVEAEAPVAVPDGWEMLRAGRAGRVHYHLLATGTS
ncbi:MAG TPA: 16S rRNA (guanine(966)-N(2))-methyltransferase RsmD [Rhodocyclaceae bacterium]|nr:MAG: 16S rRNA (guanine(966)-N(2))-methyltransferase RsmD [Rhodocyclales bacterium CG17_big_fil_post_rev_8_21_14_2_50_68_7]PIX75772.1 MAG: 16S rRNA (guanine(966)-N(2))-methyltransferase RsmD [Rhodocyclales bacterium CG_4_10_14_3_um_filter_68_10]HCX32452.1 16S rRNA (guanine(966)-N(2))-methyltransferase RsmD [Rhodocyclaceae bacterium]